MPKFTLKDLILISVVVMLATALVVQNLMREEESCCYNPASSMSVGSPWGFESDGGYLHWTCPKHPPFTTDP